MKIKHFRIEIYDENGDPILERFIPEVEGKDTKNVDIIISVLNPNGKNRDYFLMDEQEKKIIDEYRKRKHGIVDKVSGAIDTVTNSMIRWIGDE